MLNINIIHSYYIKIYDEEKINLQIDCRFLQPFELNRHLSYFSQEFQSFFFNEQDLSYLSVSMFPKNPVLP